MKGGTVEVNYDFYRIVTHVNIFKYGATFTDPMVTSLTGINSKRGFYVHSAAEQRQPRW